MRLLPLHFMMLPRYLSQTLNFIQFLPFSDYLLCQILPEKTPMQEQESDSLSLESDPIVVVTQTVDSLVQYTTDGKKIIYLFYPSTTNKN